DLQKNKTRFVFELIKNAEDNHYQNSAISHGAPHIHFSLYPDKIVVSNNEDGFTVENIKAICKIAGSTKTRTDSLSYIGEEGIGFKSVFMVASKAHIQSGPFTFFFEHPSSRDASGMGMVSPVWHNYDARAKHSGTKITLNLRNDVNRSELENQLFTDLPDTLLLFLKKLQRISIDKYDASGLLLRHTEYTCDRDDVNRKVTLTKSTLTRGSSPLKTVTRYFTTTKKLSMLPSDTQKTFNTAELVLAFPVQEGDVAPRIASKHDIYSYLSIRNSGFPFVIHSDFVTKAYGQGVMDCPRNEAIFDEAALGFVDAVVQFCQHSTLQYQWMRYLPKASIFDGFSWKLTSKIEELLRKTPVLRPHNHGPLSLISELRILPDEFKDAFSEPLFPDSPKGTYIAKGYQVGDDMSSLISLGLKTLELVDVMERLQQDLESPSSIYKAKETIKDWHTRAAKYLMTAFNGDCIPHVKKMKFIPLENGEFTSVSEGPVYFPNSDGLPIPTDLGLRLVKPEAIEDNTWRKTLFTALGVTEVSTQQVRKLIFEKYKSEASREKITVYRSVAHLRFLYWTHQDSLPRPKITGFELRLADYQSSDIREYHDLWIFDQGRLVPCHSDVYLGPSLSLLNSAYFDVVPKKASGNLSWESWLQIYLGIVRHPCLSDPNDPSKLSPIFKYLVDHRPEKLLRILKANWASYEEMLSPKLTKVISNMDIPVMDGSRRKLNTTFLPALETRAQKFLRGEEKLGVLILDSLSNAEEWRFLEKFGVSHTDNLDFYLALLSYITEENEDAEELSDPERIFELYEVIFSGQWSPEGNPGHEERIRSYFETHPALYIPSTNRRPREWMRSLGCLWDAPSYLVYHPSIMHIKEYSGNVILATSMRRILKLPNVDQEWLISELTGLTIGGNYLDNKDFIDIYQRLDMFQMEMDEKKRSAMIKEFRTEKLIFVPTQGWFSLEECLWRDSIEIQGKVAIKAQYPTLRHFFVDFLGILAPDMGVLVKELKEVATSSRSVEKAKALIWQISSMGPTAEDLASIYDSAIFPVKIGNEAVRLANRATEFAIVDNLKLARAFTTPISIGVLAVLDFSTVDEIHKLQPFLAGLKIENRYLSSIVEEITSLPGDANSSSEYAAALTADLRHRAYALSRCVFHFRSSEKQDDDRSVYEMLLGAKIFTASEIRTRYELTQNGKKFQAILDKGTLHIEKDETQLNIYVPENSRDRELCYRRLLPSRLLAKLMRDESAITTIYLDLRAVAIVADIMTCSDLIIEDLLEDAGIMRLSFPAENMSNNVPKSSLDIPKPGQVARQSDEDEISHAQAGQTAPEESPKEPKSGRFSSLPSLSGSKPREVGQRSHSNGQPTIPTVSLSQDQVLVTDLLDVNGNTPDYCRLLDDLISAATNRHGKFPSKDGLFDVKGLASALPLNQPIYDSPFGVKDENRLAYNLRIGAAGELYVFEILKRLNPPLPRFSDSNWKSSIRKYVTVHESYQDMGAWEGYEQSDIMYNDIKGEFTQLLIDNGYLDGKVWANAKPRYSLEVKSTTGDCETTFFLSIGQYQRVCANQ
ncbi:hypothetical protein OIDMADRAFT_125409, partial [Oidiodendron maius Zn]